MIEHDGQNISLKNDGEPKQVFLFDLMLIGIEPGIEGATFVEPVGNNFLWIIGLGCLMDRDMQSDEDKQ